MAKKGEKMKKDEYFKKLKPQGTYQDYFDAGWKAVLTEITGYVHALQSALFTTVIGERKKAIDKLNILKNKWYEANKL